MLKPFKTIHHFKVMLETRMVGLIAHLDYCTLGSHLLMDGITRFLRETGSEFFPQTQNRPIIQINATPNQSHPGNSLFSDGSKRNLSTHQNFA